MSKYSPLICLFCLLWCADCLAEIKVLFAPSSDIPTTIEKALDKAEQRIDLAIYNFADTRLLSRLKSAAKRGTQIRVILHNARKNQKLASALEAEIIDVRYTTLGMHHKFVIIDGPRTEKDDPSKATLLTGSSNWTRATYSRFDEDMLHFVDEPTFVSAFQNQFNHLWQHSREFGETIYTGPNLQLDFDAADVLFTSANMKPALYRGQPTFRTAATMETGVCDKVVVLLDYEINEDINDTRKPLSHAGLVKGNIIT